MLKQNELNVERSMAQRVAATLGVQADEARPLILLAVQSFFMGMMLISFYTASNALFLQKFSADDIPLVYIVSTAVLTFAGWLFSTLEKRISFPALLIGTCVFLLLSILGLRLGLELTDAPWLVFLIMIWLRFLWVVGNLVVWALAGRLFDVRQSKRLFTLVSAGAVLGMIACGLFIPSLITLIGTANLLFITAIGQVGSLFFLELALRPLRNGLSDSNEQNQEQNQEHGGLGSLPKSRYVLLIFFYTFLSILATYLMDYLFIKEAEARYADVDALARFFGNYLTINTTVLLFVSLVSGAILSRYGVKAGLLMNPVVVMIFVLTVIGTSLFLGPISALFWLIVMTKMSDEVLGVAMSATSLRILYQPLPLKQQVPMQVAVESIVNPVSVGLVGVFLLLFNTFGNMSTIEGMYLLVVLLLCWCGAGIILNREYLVALREALTKRHLGGNSLVLANIDRATIDLLKQSLDSPHVGAVIYALDMLEENEPTALPAVLPDLLRHPVPEVRVDVLRRVERLRLTSLLPTIKAHLKEIEALHGQQIDAVHCALLRVVAGLGDAQEVKEVVPYLEHRQREAREGVLVGLLRSGQVEALSLATEKIEKMASSSNADERALAADALGEGKTPLIRSLLILLEDDDIQVQRAALNAAGKLKYASFWPAVMKRLAEPPVRALAAKTLVAGGDAVLPLLGSTFEQQALHLTQKEGTKESLSQLAKIYGRIGTPNAMAFLAQQLDFPDEQVRFHILTALRQCGYQSQEPERIEQALKDDIAHICWLLALLRDLQDQAPQLSAALTSHLESYRQRLFLWLSFLHDPALIQQLEDTLRVDYLEKKAYVFEIMQTLLPNDLFSLLLLVLDDDDSALQKLEAHFPQPEKGHQERLHELINSTTTRLDRWTRACVLYSVANQESEEGEVDEALRQSVIDQLSATDPLLRESAAWSLAHLNLAKHSHHLKALYHDSNATVAKMARYLTQHGTSGGPIMLSIIEKVIALKSSTFFAKTKENILVDVAAMLKEVELKEGEVLFEKGQLGDCMYIMHSGTLRIHDGERTFEEVKEGGAFGELALLDPAPRSAQATALSKSLILRLDAAPFYELIADHSDVAQAIMQVLARRLRRW